MYRDYINYAVLDRRGHVVAPVIKTATMTQKPREDMRVLTNYWGVAGLIKLGN